MLYTQGKTDCKPGEVGYNEQRLEVLNGHLQRLIDDGEIQCATYCISRKGRVFAHGAIGKKTFHKEDNTPVQPDSISGFSFFCFGIFFNDFSRQLFQK